MLHFEPIAQLDDGDQQAGKRVIIGSIYYRFSKSDCKLVRCVLEQHGIARCPSSDSGFHLMWTGGHIKPKQLKCLLPYQRVNHFPRTVELTRKDKLYLNLTAMACKHGEHVIDFLPKSYILPVQWNELMNDCIDQIDHHRSVDREIIFRASEEFLASSSSNENENINIINTEEGNEFLKLSREVSVGPFIIKPKALSRGRGIYLTDSLAEVAKLRSSSTHLVSHYIGNPLLIDGMKFDIRLYVLVTSFSPLRVYLHREGLARFATEKYNKSTKHLDNKFIHLTNYSVNKMNSKFQQSRDSDIEAKGSKWSLSALLNRLSQVSIDVAAVMARIKSLIVKTMISTQRQIGLAVSEHVPHERNCFELFGFDILLDDAHNPWLMEVNLSPSLACDSPLDLRVKAAVIADLLNVVGIESSDQSEPAFPEVLPRPSSRSSKFSSFDGSISDGLDVIAAEHARCGKFEMIYPSPSCSDYDHLFDRVHPLTSHIVTRLFGSSKPSVPKIVSSSRSQSFPVPRPASSFSKKPAAVEVPDSRDLPRYSLYSKKPDSQQSISKHLPFISSTINQFKPPISPPPPPVKSMSSPNLNTSDLFQSLVKLTSIELPPPSSSSLRSSLPTPMFHRPAAATSSSSKSWLLSVPIEEFEPIHIREVFICYMNLLKQRLASILPSFSPAPAVAALSTKPIVESVASFLETYDRSFTRTVPQIPQQLFKRLNEYLVNYTVDARRLSAANPVDVQIQSKRRVLSHRIPLASFQQVLNRMNETDIEAVFRLCSS